MLLIQGINEEMETFFLNRSSIFPKELEGLCLVWVDDEVTVPLQEPKYGESNLEDDSKKSGKRRDVCNGENQNECRDCKDMDSNSDETVDGCFL